jgi:predicted flap endonuclease-1-like 5' DNA nuclease
MRLTSLQLHSPELRLDDLSPGFNLIFAPQGETRRLIPAALHCVLFGTPTDDLLPDDERSICELDALSPWGRFELQRVVSPQGDRFLARDSKGQNRSKWLQQRMLAEVTEGRFSSIYTPRFGDHAAFEALVRQALGESGAPQRRASLENLLREFEATRPWDRQDKQAAKLQEQETRLLAELEQLEKTPDVGLAADERTDATLVANKISLWQRRLVRTQERIRDARQRLEVARKTPTPDLVRSEKVQLQLAQTGEQIERLETVLGDLEKRERELLAPRKTMPQARPERGRSRTLAAARYAQIMQSLAEMARKLGSEITAINSQPELDTVWSAAADRLLPRLESLNEKLRQLCRRLQHPESPPPKGSERGEREQLTRCQHDLRAQLTLLIQRRESLRQKLTGSSAITRVDTDQIHTLENILARLAEREQRCQRRLIRWRDSKRAPRPIYPSQKALRQRAEVSRELAEVRLQLAELTRRDKQESATMLERMRALLTDRRIPVIFEEASRTLRQLTDGELIAIRPRTWGNDVVIEHAHGKAVTFDVLSRGERDQVQLSLSLATAADAAHRGNTFPLVLDDALRHVEPGRLRSAVELLRDHCRLHGQILLLSSQQNVATLCRSIGVASFYLDQLHGHSAIGTSLGRAAEHAGAVDEEQRLRFASDASRTQEAGWVTAGESTWDCEEFPGELRDRINRDHIPFSASETVSERPSEFPRSVRSLWSESPSTPAEVPWNGSRGTRPATTNGRDLLGKKDSKDRESTGSGFDGPSVHIHGNEGELDEDAYPMESLRSTGYFLQLCDRMTEAPITTLAISRAIENCGIYTVANFLHADPVRLAERLQDLDVTSSQLRRWQGQARLMCGVRKLRGYDAKILVACGVTSPEQLADIRPHELSEMVEAFVATPEGSRIVRSGSDFEISRITQWIRSVGRVPSGADRFPSRNSERRNGTPQRARTVASVENRSTSQAPRSDHSRESSPQRSKPVNSSRSVRTDRASPIPSTAPDLLPLKFFLEESSHVEAAPSIGPQMAQRLEKIGVITVANLLAQDPAEMADRLRHRRVSAEVVGQWQRQAELVCRIPQLRGHDAQILVACEVTTPEELASRKPAELYSKIMPFVRSKAGQRILRQGKEPTVEEVADWVTWACYARQLAAA